MRLLVRTRLQTMFFRDFSRIVVSTPDPPRRRGLFQHDNHFAWQADFMDFVAVTKKREHFPGTTTMWSRCMCCYHWCLRLGEGYLTSFSFACSSVMPPYGDLSQCSEPTNPCPKAVHMEPAPSSVFKVRSGIVATATKICTIHCSLKALALTLSRCICPPTR